MTTVLPTFSYSFLHPKYWIIWIGIIFLYLLVLLPYPILYYFGIQLGKVAMYFMKYRKRIIDCNLKLCFPNMSQKDRKLLIRKNFKSIGMGLIETGIAWFWPNWRVKRLANVTGIENITRALSKNRGILLIGLHFLTLELAARIFGIYNPGIGVYRPNNNPLIDWLQTRGRLRSNKSMINRSDIKGIVRALKKGEIVWYAPDHDYGSKSSIFVPLFSVSHVATTVGTYFLVKTTHSTVVPFFLKRMSNYYKYELLIFPEESNNIPLNDQFSFVSYINKVVENIILLAPDQYMWLHRRFKTRPVSESSFYS